MFIKVLAEHFRFLLCVFFLAAVAGIILTFQMPVALFPHVDFPRVLVSVEAGLRPTDRMAFDVTLPIEEVVRRVPGIISVRSTTSRGKADININFDWGMDMEKAALQVRGAISQISSSLPAETQVAVRRMDPTAFPMLAYSLTSDNASPTVLHDIAQYQLLPLFFNVQGVADVEVLGGALEEYHVTVDPARLQAQGLAISDVSKALSSANTFSAVGKLEQQYQLYLVVADAKLQTPDQIGKIVVKTTAQRDVLHLGDIAKIERSTVPQWIHVSADGKDAVIIQVFQQPGSNTVQIAHDIQSKLESYQHLLPSGVIVAGWYDQSLLVKESASSVRDAILLGIALAALVLLVLLRNIKVSAIVLLMVPAVMAITVALMYLLNVGFNIMSLGGLAAGVGLIIDDAIVMNEYIIRKLRANNQSVRTSILQSARDFFPSLFGSSASTIVIFVPLAFLGGVTGAFFKTLSLTIASSLLVSFFVTWLAIPMLAHLLLNESDAQQSEDNRFLKWLEGLYTRCLRLLLARPLLIFIGILPLLLAGVLAYHNVGTGFMPLLDEGGFILDYRTKPGTSLTETDRLVRQVEDIVRSMPEVLTYTRRTGTQLGGALTEASEGDFFIRLKPYPRRPIDQVMEEIRFKVESLVPGLSVELAQLMEDMIGDLTGVPQPIEIKIYSDDSSSLRSATAKVMAEVSKIPGIVDVRDNLNVAGDSVEIHIDRNKAAIEGMDPSTVTATLFDYINGVVTTQLQTNIKPIGIRLWVASDLRSNERELHNLQLRAPDGHYFPLTRIAEFAITPGLPQINRENLKQMAAITARIENRDLGSVMQDIKHLMSRSNLLPSGFYYELGGLYQQQQAAFVGLMWVFATAAALVFLLLLLLFEDFRISLAIIVMPLIAMSAVFIGLWATGIELNISSMMGMTMILGIMTEVAIFYFAEYQQLTIHGDRAQNLIDAGNRRMRPIVMTTLATILTLLPLALSYGHGAAMHKPLAIAIISGLIVQLPLVLLVMPIAFYALRSR